MSVVLISLIPLAVLVAIAWVILQFLEAKKEQSPRKLPGLEVEPTPSLFTPAEQAFAASLDSAIASDPALAQDTRWIGKVRLADLVKPKRGLGSSKSTSIRNRIQLKHVDFVILDAHLKPRLVIELDDKSHARPDRQTRDALVDEALRQAGLPVIHIPVARSYSIDEITALLTGSVSREPR